MLYVKRQYVIDLMRERGLSYWQVKSLGASVDVSIVGLNDDDPNIDSAIVKLVKCIDAIEGGTLQIAVGDDQFFKQGGSKKMGIKVKIDRDQELREEKKANAPALVVPPIAPNLTGLPSLWELANENLSQKMRIFQMELAAQAPPKDTNAAATGIAQLKIANFLESLAYQMTGNNPGNNNQAINKPPTSQEPGQQAPATSGGDFAAKDTLKILYGDDPNFDKKLQKLAKIKIENPELYNELINNLDLL